MTHMKFTAVSGAKEFRTVVSTIKCAHASAIENETHFVNCFFFYLPSEWNSNTWALARARALFIICIPRQLESNATTFFPLSASMDVRVQSCARARSSVHSSICQHTFIHIFGAVVLHTHIRARICKCDQSIMSSEMEKVPIYFVCVLSVYLEWNYWHSTATSECEIIVCTS